MKNFPSGTVTFLFTDVEGSANQLSIIDYQLSIINYRLSIIDYQLSMFNAQFCICIS